MQIAATVSRRDIVLLHWHLLRRGSGDLVFALALIFIFYQVVTRHKPADLAYYASAFTVSVLAATVFSLLSWAISVVLSLLKNTVKNGVLGPHDYSLTAKGLHEVSAFKDCIHIWGGIQSVIRAESFILFKVSRRLYHIIPRRSFSSTEQFESFYALACEVKNGSKH